MKDLNTILIVDDDLSGRIALEQLLQDEGYRLIFAQDGKTALQEAIANTPDLILLDVEMPDMNGFEVCKHLRVHEILAETQIILVTGLGDRQSRLLGIEVGADDFISKPYDALELLAKVRAVIRLNRYRRLLAERAKFEWVIEQAKDGYILIDEAGYIHYANPKARQYLALPTSKDELISLTFRTLAAKLYHLEPEAMWANWPPSVTNNLSAYPALFLIQPESSTSPLLWLQVDIVPMPIIADKNILIRLSNVTEKTSLKGEIWKFHTLIQHKLRTPLTSMLGGLELLASGGEWLEATEITEFAQIALQGATRLKGELEDILQYLSVPSLAKDSQGFAFAQFEQTVSLINNKLELASLVTKGLEQVKGAKLLLSAQAFELILWELLENTKKFHPQGLPKVEIVLTKTSPKEINIKICDDGMTLTQAQLVRAWLPYEQIEEKLSGQVAGMGLGLAMVASLVWNIGGSCQIYNQQNSPGIIVELNLPLASDITIC